MLSFVVPIYRRKSLHTNAILGEIFLMLTYSPLIMIRNIVKAFTSTIITARESQLILSIMHITHCSSIYFFFA